MGLEEFKSDTSYDVGAVKTRKSIESVTIGENEWIHFLMHSPRWAITFTSVNSQYPSTTDINEAKAVVQTMDKILKDDINTSYTSTASEEQKDNIRKVREEIVHWLKKHE